MGQNRKTALVVGILYIIGTGLGILSVIFINPILKNENYLSLVADHKLSIEAGALCVLIMGFTLAFIPILLFPILKKHNEVLAIGYIVFRSALECLSDVIVAISKLLLIPLSEGFVNYGISNELIYTTLGSLLQKLGDLPMTVFPFGIGALILYIVFYQSKLIPRWLSVWGIIAIVLHLLTGFMLILGFTNNFSTLDTLMNFPIFLQEMVMAVWLIVRGFNADALAK